MKGYKGFNKDWTCKSVKFKIGKTVTHDGELSMCKSGLHFCEDPLDVLRYYGPATSNYAEVEADKVSDTTHKDDSKRVCGAITATAQLSLSAVIKAGVSWLTERSKKVAATAGYSSPAATAGNSSHAATAGDSSPAATAGDSSHAATAGNSSHAATAGNYSHAATAGDSSPAATAGYSSPAATAGNYSHAATAGDSSPAATAGNSSHAATSGAESIACAIGYNSKTKAAKGSWIVCAEYDNGKVVCVKTVKVDGKRIKADTWYRVVNKKWQIVKE